MDVLLRPDPARSGLTTMNSSPHRFRVPLNRGPGLSLWRLYPPAREELGPTGLNDL